MKQTFLKKIGMENLYKKLIEKTKNEHYVKKNYKHQLIYLDLESDEDPKDSDLFFFSFY